ncbi:MAG TPA: DUF547 domain-containing protein [Vicinamibacterales bacterium]|nr:DUF547 domain-containing protein [Vicinamibacterales bacterium]
MQISTSRIKLDWRLQLPVVLLTVLLAGGASRAQDANEDSRRTRFDEILDLNVRDGFVYYRALKSERARLDGYLASLASVQLDSSSPQEQVAFWLNGYNAIVLRTVIDHYPITARTKEYPANSIRQIPGAFERQTHRLAGRTLTLDQIEQTVLPAFHDPRVFFALGRGAVGSGRLRSEAYTPDKLERQLAEDAAECAGRAQCVQVDAAQNVMRVSAIFSWRREQFVEAYADRARTGFASRSPIERAVLAFIDPKMLTAEQGFLAKNAFRMEYLPFDWSLNDLTGRGGR